MNNSNDETHKAGKAELPMKPIRAKFICQSVADHGDTKSIVLTPVTNGSDEDKSFWKWTPSGKIELQVLNPDVKFVPKKSYYVEFTEAES